MNASAAAARAAVVFRVGSRRLAVDAAQIAAVARRPRLTRVPHAPAALAGVGALSGRATPIVDLARVLGEGRGGGAQLLVVRGDDPLAVAVDVVEGVREPGGLSADWLDLRQVIAPMFEHGGRRLRGAADVARGAATRAEGGERELGFLEFALAGQRFAFPIEQVRAVIPEPAGLIAVAGADPVVAGLAPDRSGVLPVVELADLLGLDRPPASALARLFVVEIGRAAVGLRVGRALGALRVKAGAVSLAPALLNRGHGEARVSAIARTPDGLTAILTAERLFDEATTRRLEALADAAPEIQPTTASGGEVQSVLVFSLGEERYGLPVAAVEAVGRPPKALSPPPNAPLFLAGMMAHRGRPTPLVDQRARFGCGPAAPAAAVVFVRSGAVSAGLLVDAVERIVRIPLDELQAAPPLAGDAGALFSTVSAAELDGRPLLVADPESLLGQARRDLLAWSAAQRPAARA